MSFGLTHLIDVLGTFTFAAAGAFAAMEKKLDPFGVLIIAFATAIGGGTIRDVLIGDLPVAWLKNMTAVWIIIAGTSAALFFGTYLKKLDKMLFVLDALGLGLFTMIGIQKGIDHHLHSAICIMLGTVTGCFGGVLRDVLLNNVPLIFHKEIYAMASVMGGVIFFMMLSLKWDPSVSYITGIIIVFVIRVLAVRFNWSLPKFYETR